MATNRLADVLAYAARRASITASPRLSYITEPAVSFPTVNLDSLRRGWQSREKIFGAELARPDPHHRRCRRSIGANRCERLCSAVAGRVGGPRRPRGLGRRAL